MHIVISWDKDEKPTQQQEKEAWQIALKNLGMEKHEMVFAGHSNTYNYHSHGLISRVDPNSDNSRLKLNGGSVEKKSCKKMRNNEIKCLHKAVAEICNKQGWNAEHNMYDSNLQLKSQLNSDKIRLGQKIESEEARTGTISKERLLAEKSIDILRDSKSWKEAQEKLLQDKISIEFTEKNGKLGAVLISENAKVKFSALPSDCSRKNLDAKYNTNLEINQQTIETAIQIPQNWTPNKAKIAARKVFNNATSFKEAEKSLQEQGLHIERYGEKGAYLKYGENEDEKMKLSSIGSEYSLYKLEKKYNESIINGEETMEHKPENQQGSMSDSNSSTQKFSMSSLHSRMQEAASSTQADSSQNIQQNDVQQVQTQQQSM